MQKVVEIVEDIGLLISAYKVDRVQGRNPPLKIQLKIGEIELKLKFVGRPSQLDC